MEPNITRIVQNLYRLRIWENKKFPISNYHKCFHICVFGLFYLFFGITLAVGAIISDSLTETVYLSVVFLTLLSLIVNLLTFSRNQNDVESILNKILIEKDSEVYDKILKFTKFTYYFKLLVALMSTSAVIFPLSQGLLPYGIWFPLDWKHNVTSYGITITYCLISHAVNVVTLVSLRLFVWFVMINASLQYELLGIRLRNLGQKMIHDSIHMNQLKECLIAHRRVKRTIERFRNCFAYVFLFQLTIGAFCICGPIFLITRANVTIMGCIFYVCLIMFMVLDISTITYFGNEITIKSNDLSQCLYESNWISQPLIYQKCLIISMEFFVQPQRLIIGFLFPLDLKTLTSILNSTFTMFNILRNL